MTTYATLLESGGASRFTGLDFNSAAVIDGDLYLLTSIGLVKCEGYADAGVAIGLSIDFGREKFKTENVKRLVDSLVNCQGDAPVTVTVESEQGTFDYEAETQSDTLKNHRIKLGRGLSGTWFRFILRSASLSASKLAGAVFNGLSIQRRI